MKRVVIIGGGMAGLAAAHECQQQEGIEWQLLDASDRLGGKIVTDHVDGFVIEGGPDSFITQKPAGVALCEELGLESELIPCNSAAQKVFILSNGQLCELPEGFRLTVPTRLMPFLRSPLFSWRAKVRMGLEPLVPPKRDNEDESISAFITRRLGKEAADKIGGPLMAGIYVADPERLSLLSTFPMFRTLEQKYGSLIHAMRHMAKRPASGQPMFMSMKQGMGQLVQAISQPLLKSCQLGVHVDAIEQSETEFRILCNNREIGADEIILATPPAQAAQLLEKIDAASATELRQIRTVSTATVSLGFALPLEGIHQPMDGFGFVIPASENRRILACTWSSMKFPGRAPQDHALMRVFIGGERGEQWLDRDDEGLVKLALAELESIWGLTSVPVVSRVYRWPNGNPQYDVGHAQRMHQLLESLAARAPGIHLAGSGYRGIGLPDCIASGRGAAQRVVGNELT